MVTVPMCACILTEPNLNLNTPDILHVKSLGKGLASAAQLLLIGCLVWPRVYN